MKKFHLATGLTTIAALSLALTTAVTPMASAGTGLSVSENAKPSSSSSKAKTTTVKAPAKTANTVASKKQKTELYSKTNKIYSLKTTWPTRLTQSLAVYNIHYGAGRTAYIERYNSKKKKYDRVKTIKIGGKAGKNSYETIKFTLPAESAAGKKTYRLNLPETKYATAFTKTFSVTNVDPRKYTGYKKTSYNWMKGYCPNIIIQEKKLKGNLGGTYQFGLKLVTIQKNMNAFNMRNVSIHECAHSRQDDTYKGDYNKLAADSNKLFKTKGSLGLEKLADCMTKVKTNNTSYGGYLKNNKCSAAELAAAKKVWAGKKL